MRQKAITTGYDGNVVFIPFRSRRWAVGYADPILTSLAIRAHLLRSWDNPEDTDKFSLRHVKWLFWAGLFQVQYLGVTLNYCNSCRTHRNEVPADHCKNVGFHETHSRVRYSRLPTGPRTYLLDADGNPPANIYETKKERAERLRRELDAQYIPMAIRE